MQLVGMNQAKCPQCGETTRPDLEHAVTPDSPLAGETLATLGIPPYDIVKVDGGRRRNTCFCWRRPREGDGMTENHQIQRTKDQINPKSKGITFKRVVRRVDFGRLI